MAAADHIVAAPALRRAEPTIEIRDARLEDIPLVLGFIRGLAEYERMLDQPAIDFYESLGATRLREWQLGQLPATDLAPYA